MKKFDFQLFNSLSRPLGYLFGGSGIGTSQDESFFIAICYFSRLSGPPKWPFLPIQVIFGSFDAFDTRKIVNIMRKRAFPTMCLDQIQQKIVLGVQTKKRTAENRTSSFLTIFSYIFHQKPIHIRPSFVTNFHFPKNPEKIHGLFLHHEE